MAEDITFATPAEQAVTVSDKGIPKIAIDPMSPIPAPYTFTPEQFKEDIKTFGLPNLTAAIVDLQQGSALEGSEYTYESLVDGSAPFLSKYGEELVPGYRPGEGLRDEQILSLFTNVQDFAGKTSPEFAAFIEGAKRGSVRGGGMLAGAIAGGKTAAALTSPIPPVGPLPIAIKGGTIIGGTILGAIFGDLTGKEAGEVFFGEQAPVVPSLQPYYNAAETSTYGVSMLGSPWLLPRKAGATGALRFLDNFQRTARGAGSTSPVAQNLTQQIGKEVLSPKALQKALDAGKLGPRRNLLGKITPDPTKGPLSSRAIGALDEGVVKMGEFGRKAPIRAGALELGFAGGAGGGAYIAESMAPGDDLIRVGAEVVGTGIVPATAQIGIRYAPQLVLGPIRLARKYLTGSAKEEFDSKLKDIAGGRIYKALEEGPTKPGFEDVPDLTDAEFDLLVKTIGSALIDDQGRPLRSFTRESILQSQVSPDFATEFGVISAQLAAKNNRFSRIVNRIEQELERAGNELSVSSKKGRESYIQGQKAIIEEARRDGSTDGIKLAAELQQNLFDQNITDNLNAAVSNLNKAVGRVTGGDEADGLVLAGKLYDIIENQVKVSGERSQKLWQAVDGTVEIRQFFNEAGEELSEPNLVSIFDKPSLQGGLKFASESAKDKFWNSLGGGMKRDYDEIVKYFRPDGDGGGRESLSPEFQTKLDDLNTELKNFSEGDRFAVIKSEQDRLLRKDPATEEGKYFQVLQSMMDRAADPTQVPDFPVTTARLVEMRSIALEEAKALRATGKKKQARNVEIFANSILDDLINNPDFTNEGYNIARAYTKARADVFERSFIGDLQATQKRGDRRLSAEALLDKIKGAGSVAEYQRLMEIGEVGNFALRQNLPGAGTTILTIHEAMENVVRVAMKDVVDVKDGVMTVNPGKLATYKKKPATQEVFRVFPQLALDLQDAQTAQRMFDQLGEDLKALKPRPETKALQAALQNESPTGAVTVALNGGRPQASMNELLSLTNLTDVINPETGAAFTKAQLKDGLRIAILDHAANVAGNTGFKFNPRSMYDMLFTTVKGAKPADNMKLSTFMLDHELISAKHLNKIQKALREMINVEDAFARGDVEQVLFDRPTGAKMFQAKMIGATLGQAAQNQFNKLLSRFGLDIGGGIGGGLVAAQEGSQQIQNLLFRMPEAARIKAMTEIMNDPRTLSLMLLDQRTKAQQRSATSKMNDFLVQMGLNFTSKRAPYVERAISSEIEESGAGSSVQEKPPVGPVSSIAPTAMPAPRPPVPAQPVAQPTTTLASAPPPPPAPSGPVDRARFAAMFPEDADLVRGIGSLRT